MAAGNYTTTSHKPYEGEMYTDEQLARTVYKTSACGISTVDIKGNEMATEDEMKVLRARTHGETENPSLVVFFLVVAVIVGILFMACRA